MKTKGKVTAQKNSKFLLAVLCLSVFTASCSLKYEQDVPADEKTPELSFTQASFSRYENNDISFRLEASLLEQYKKTNLSFAKDAQFFTWDENQKLDTTGASDLLSLDQNNEIYTLFDNISISNLSNNVEIYADALRYNGQTEQLTSNRDTMVYISRDGTQISGKGFSASGISKSFSFTSEIEGEIITEEDTSNESN